MLSTKDGSRRRTLRAQIPRPSAPPEVTNVDYPEHVLADGLSPPDGLLIKKVLEHVVEVAELHAVLNSPRRQYLRRRLLQSLRSAMTIDEIDGLRREFGAQEYERHIHKFLRWGLVKQVATGEGGLNTVRELQRKVGEERATSIAEAGLGSNAIKLFLTIFGNPKELDLTTREIVYTPLEIGQLIRIFSRCVEGVSAIDKLDDARLTSYLEDGNVHVNPRRSTTFYHYLRNLYFLLARGMGNSYRAEEDEHHRTSR